MKDQILEIESLQTFIATISGVVIFVHIESEAVLLLIVGHPNIYILSDTPYTINIKTRFVGVYLTCNKDETLF